MYLIIYAISDGRDDLGFERVGGKVRGQVCKDHATAIQLAELTMRIEGYATWDIEPVPCASGPRITAPRGGVD